MPKRILGDFSPQLISFGCQLGQFFLIGRCALACFFFFFIVLGCVGLQLGIGDLKACFAIVGGDHQFQNLIFRGGDFLFGELDLLHQGPVFLIGFHIQRLIAVFADLLLLVLDVGFVFLARGLVGLGSGEC